MPLRAPRGFIAEDDPLLQRLYKQAFKLRGYTVELTVDGEDAMKRLDVRAEIFSSYVQP